MTVLYTLPAAPKACPENTIVCGKGRFTVLTDRLVRMEYSKGGAFEDRATQKVLNRDFTPAAFTASEEEEALTIETACLKITWDKRPFSAAGLTVEIRGFGLWHYGDRPDNLKGTRRTLDGINGPCWLEDGLMSRRGYAVLDDSESLAITEEGWVAVRERAEDLYFWGYGHDYFGCLRDFYHLCGKTPMLPRYALGNWWSRYYPYTEKTYTALMDRFEEENVPLSVAVLDMDWHWVDIDPKYGSGWTGYSWNTDFFPDPDRFLRGLHTRGLKVTMNVHPAEGVQAHEDMYLDMAKAMGVDYTKEEPIPFDITNPAFLSAYFQYLHHDHEKRGVDFWWIDWQQGTTTGMEGLDPLWMLNHFHFLDSGREGKRPMTFSRYAGPGSHRYPIGFSGDARITWPMLDFQPYFTATASNIGYGWWSHDIGGHTLGAKDDELAARWLQFGVFSPVNRLHSTNNIFNGKEPWRYNPEVHTMMNRFLRLRHRMIPYLYTMNYRAYAEDRPLICPMYYLYPDSAQAYAVKNQYAFGTELLAVPVTTRRLAGINRAKTEVWLPDGLYTDFFTGMLYRGGRVIEMYRDIHTMPVLARAGAIVPMTEDIFHGDALKNPQSLLLRVFPGEDGHFRLYEDDNETQQYQRGICVTTDFVWNWPQKTFTIQAAQGETSLLPEQRRYTLEFYGVTESTASFMTEEEIWQDASCRYDAARGVLTAELPAQPAGKAVTVRLHGAALADNQVMDRLFAFLSEIETDFEEKEHIWKLLQRTKEPEEALIEMDIMGVDKALIGCLREFLTAL